MNFNEIGQSRFAWDYDIQTDKRRCRLVFTTSQGEHHLLWSEPLSTTEMAAKLRELANRLDKKEP